MKTETKQRLFDYFSQEHNISLMDSDYNELEAIHEAEKGTHSIISQIEGLKFKTDEYSDKWKFPHNEAIDAVLSILRQSYAVEAEKVKKLTIKDAMAFYDLSKDFKLHDDYSFSVQTTFNMMAAFANHVNQPKQGKP